MGLLSPSVRTRYPHHHPLRLDHGVAWVVKHVRLYRQRKQSRKAYTVIRDKGPGSPRERMLERRMATEGQVVASTTGAERPGAA